MSKKNKLFDLANLTSPSLPQFPIKPVSPEPASEAESEKLQLDIKSLFESVFKDPTDNTEVLSSINSKLDVIIDLLKRQIDK